MVADPLVARWLEPVYHQLRTEVLQSLQRRGDLSSVTLGTVDGRADLRGFPLSRNLARFAGQENSLRNVTLTDVDLSLADLTGLMLLGAQIRNCRFDGADCGGLRLFGADVDQCSFDTAILTRAALGPWYQGRGNTFTRTSFVAATMTKIETSAATYVDCDFSRAALDGVNFWQSSLIRCRFAGDVTDVIFDGRMLGAEKPDPNPMLDVDFSGAHFTRVQFRGIKSFDRVTLPTDPGLHVIERYPEVLRAALPLLPAEKSRNVTMARAIIENELRGLSDPASQGLYDRSVFTEIGGEPLADLMETTLEQAQKLVEP